VEGRLVQLGIAKSLLNRVQSSAEEIGVQLFESGTSDGGVEVEALEKRVNLDVGLGGGRQGPLGPFAGRSESPHGSLVGRHVLLVFPLELLDEVIDHSAVEVLSTEMSVSGRRLDLEDSILDGQDGDIESSTAEIKDEDVILLAGGVRILLIEAVSDGGGRGFIDDSEDIQTGNDSCIFGGLTLRVIKVGGYSDDCIIDSHAEVSFGGFLHLGEDHRRDFFSIEGLGLALVLDLDLRLGVFVDDSERPVLDVSLDRRIVKLPSDESLCIEDGVVRVHRDLILGGVADQTLGVGERHIGGRSSVTLQ